MSDGSQDAEQTRLHQAISRGKAVLKKAAELAVGVPIGSTIVVDFTKINDMSEIRKNVTFMADIEDVEMVLFLSGLEFTDRASPKLKYQKYSISPASASFVKVAD